MKLNFMPSRNQPNPKDRWILVESRPELIRHNLRQKIPYKIKKNGGTSTAIENPGLKMEPIKVGQIGKLNQLIYMVNL